MESNMKLKIILISILFCLNTAMLQGFDNLFEKKLKHIKQFNPDKSWVPLKFDDSFSLNFKGSESFIKSIASIAVRNDKLFILDNLRDKLLTFDTNGNFLKSIGRRGRGPGDLHAPYWMEIYQKKIYIYNNNGIEIFGQNLNFVNRIRPFLQLRRFALDNESIYCSTKGSYKGKYPLLIKINMHGRVEETINCEDLKDPLFRISKLGHEITSKKQVVFVSKHWNRVYFYEKDSKSLKRVKINYGLLDKIEEWNDRKMNRKPGGMIWFSNMIAAARSHQGKIYLLLKIPRLEIISIDNKGNIQEHYFNNEDFRFMRWYDFDIEQKKEQLYFYVSGGSIGEEKRSGLSEDSVYRVVVPVNRMTGAHNEQSK